MTRRCVLSVGLGFFVHWNSDTEEWIVQTLFCVESRT